MGEIARQRPCIDNKMKHKTDYVPFQKCKISIVCMYVEEGKVVYYKNVKMWPEEGCHNFA